MSARERVVNAKRVLEKPRRRAVSSASTGDQQGHHSSQHPASHPLALHFVAIFRYIFESLYRSEQEEPSSVARLLLARVGGNYCCPQWGSALSFFGYLGGKIAAPHRVFVKNRF